MARWKAKYIKRCTVCKKEYYNSNIRACKHAKGNGRAICRYCCQRCKYNVKVGTGQRCDYNGGKQWTT